VTIVKPGSKKVPVTSPFSVNTGVAAGDTEGPLVDDGVIVASAVGGTPVGTSELGVAVAAAAARVAVAVASSGGES
jgi:hypothetical protein